MEARILKRGITAYMPVFNEESRIKYILQSLIWCDEVILIDKRSTDKTIEIAKTFSNVRIFYIDNTDGYKATEELEIPLRECQYEYTMLATASDIIHPELALEIKKLINNSNFNYDAIRVPYKGYFLGMYEKFSPWYAEREIRVLKYTCIKVNPGDVHFAVTYNVKTIYDIKINNQEVAFYHLTHESADSIMVRHIRYWKGEANSPESLRKPLEVVIRKTIRFLFIQRTFFSGKAAIALAFSYLSYYMLSYVYRWDCQYGKANDIYMKLRTDNFQEWEKYKQQSND